MAPAESLQFPVDFQQHVQALALALQAPFAALNKKADMFSQQVAEAAHAQMGLQ